MKTAISLPDPVFEEAESLARQLGVSRSELYTNALKAYLRKYNRDQILNRLNQVYAEESSALDPVLAKIQFMSLPCENRQFNDEVQHPGFTEVNP
jgi:metal-responsive CopG/Arc/MetJ family transcriptional regulator